MISGYVYVIAFDDGTLKVGRSQDAEIRLRTHGQTAKGFGLSVTGKWSSPEHVGWVENEAALKALAEELGGVCRGDEWFTGVDFGELVARAANLKFSPPNRPEKAGRPTSGRRRGDTSRSLRREPPWLLDEATWFARTGIPCEGITEQRAIRELRDRLIASEQGLIKSLAENYVSTRLKGALLMVRREAGEREKAITRDGTDDGITAPDEPEEAEAAALCRNPPSATSSSPAPPASWRSTSSTRS